MQASAFRVGLSNAIVKGPKSNVTCHNGHAFCAIRGIGGFSFHLTPKQ